MLAVQKADKYVGHVSGYYKDQFPPGGGWSPTTWHTLSILAGRHQSSARGNSQYFFQRFAAEAGHFADISQDVLQHSYIVYDFAAGWTIHLGSEDATQQDLLRKSTESHSILQTVASTQQTMVTKMELLDLDLP